MRLPPSTAEIRRDLNEIAGGVRATRGGRHGGRQVAQTERIIAAEMRRRRWNEAELTTRAKGDAVNVALAARLRAQTTRTAAWTAGRLAMGTRGHLNHLLYRRRKAGAE